MKINNIKIENIASLKGNHYIDFRSFGDQNSTFAITGETGSGKSTILNSISLSLYGQNYKKNLNQLDFITLGEAEGRIELQFEIKNETYKAVWSCRLKKSNGEYLKTPKPKRDLFKLNKLKWIALEILPEQIINLTFDQFCKTMILNQGEFSKFLTSSFKERKEILERFYDGEKLEQLSVKTRQKITKLNQEIENNNFQIAGLNASNLDDEVDEDKLKLKKEKLSIFRELHKSSDKANAHLKDIINLDKDIQKNKQRYTKINEETKEITNTNNKLKNSVQKFKFEKVQFDQRYNKEEPKLIECRDLERKSKLLEQEIIQNQKEVEQLNKSLEQQQSHLTNQKHKHHTLDQQVNENKLNTLYINMDPRNIDSLIELNTQKKQIASSKELIAKQIELQSNSISEIQTEADQLKQHNEKINNTIGEQSLESINEKIIQSEKDLKSLDSALIKFDSFQAQKMENEEYIIELNTTNKNSQKKLSKLERELEELKFRKEEVESALKYYKISQAVELCFHESQQTGQCLVCQNDNLPKSLKANTNKIDEKKYNYSKKSLEETLVQISKIETEITKCSLSIDNNHKAIKASEEKSTLLTTNLIETTLKEYKNITNINELTFIKVITEHLNQAEKKTIKLRELKQNIHSMVLQKNQNELLLDKLRTKYKLNSDSINEQKIKLKKHYELLMNIDSDLEDQIPNDKDNPNLTQMLQFSKNAFITDENLRSLSQQISQNSKRVDEIKASISNKQTYIQKLKSEVSQSKDFIYKTVKEQSPDKLLNQLKHDKEQISKKLNQINEELKVSEINLAQKTSQLKSTFEQIDQATNQQLICLKEFKDLFSNDIDRNIDNLTENELITLNSYYRFIDKVKDAKDISNPNIEIFNDIFEFSKSQSKLFQDHIEELNYQITEELTLLKQKKQSLEKIKTITEAIKSIEKKKLQLEDLYTLVGRDEFRNYVLSIIEKRLITQTNNEIKTLCDDRYKLVHFSKSNKMSPDFYVIDKYKAGLTRKVSTLSGGETFMVSLAMAMALSELSRGTNEIDSFFIDEGFGTLDDDSLEDVLEMINNIQARGKSIGLITHVNKLADRIPINIQLKKSELGNSSIMINFH